MCAKEVGTEGTLGILVTIPPEVPAKFVGAGGWTTWLARVKGVAGILVLGAPTGGGGTPSAEAAEVEVEELSPVVDIILPKGTPITGGLKGWT